MLAAVATAALAAGCADEGSPSADPSPTTVAESSEAQLPYAGAPKVEKPITGTESLQKDPCKVLTAADIKWAGFSNERMKKYQGKEGPRCSWHGSGASMQVMWNTSGTGLSGSYDDRSSGERFEPTTIGGQPAAVSGQLDDECTVVVGLEDDLSVAGHVIMKEGTPTDEVCKVSKQLSERIIKNLKARSGS